MSEHLGNMALLFFVTLAVSLVLTPMTRRFAIRRNWLDRPGEARRVHAVAVPRLGGLAIYAAFTLGVLLTFVFDINRVRVGNGRYESSRVLLMLAGATLITAVMAIDDIQGLRPRTKLVWQIAAAVLVIMPSLAWPGGPNPGEAPGTMHYDQGAGVFTTSIQSPFGGTIELPLVLGAVFTLFWIVGMTNTINWIDGLDGLAGGVTALACMVLFIITGPVLGQYTLAYLPLLLAAATLGFLPYNIHPARIFMGDSGAMFIGYTLAILSIIGGAKIAAALLVLGIPMLDALYLIVFRLYRGKSPASADRGHLHHRLLDVGLSQPQVVLIFYLLTGAFGVLAPLVDVVARMYKLPTGPIKLPALVIMAVVLTTLLAYISRRQFDRTGASDKSG